jgi:hypothetical protein
MSFSIALLLKQYWAGFVACHIAAATVCNHQNNASNLVRIKLILLFCRLFHIIVKSVNGQAICLSFFLSGSTLARLTEVWDSEMKDDCKN